MGPEMDRVFAWILKVFDRKKSNSVKQQDVVSGVRYI